MALETSDIIPVQKTTGGTGSVRKATVGALLALAEKAATYWEKVGKKLTPIDDEDYVVIPKGNLIVGQQIFDIFAPTNVGVETHATKGAIHIRSADNTDIASFEIFSAGSQSSHYKVLGSGDLKIGANVNDPATTNIELNPDGSAFFRGHIDGGSIDGGEYAT